MILEVYAQLVVATISFVAPALIGLVTISMERLRRAEICMLEQEDKLIRWIKNSVANHEGKDFWERMSLVNGAVSSFLKYKSTKTKLLSPKYQLMKVYFFLGLSLVFLFLALTIDEVGTVHQLPSIVRPILLGLSVFTLLVALAFLRLILWTVLEIKRQMDRLEFPVSIEEYFPSKN